MTRTHRILALVIGILVPLGSCVLGSGELSYGMYARTSEARLDVFAFDAAGARHRVAPSALARGARASVVPLVAGADHWRSQPRLGELRNALPSLARHACTVELGAHSVEVVLEERGREGDAVRTTRALVECAP